MNWRGEGRKAVVVLCEAPSGSCLEELKETKEKPQSG